MIWKIGRLQFGIRWAPKPANTPNGVYAKLTKREKWKLQKREQREKLRVKRFTFGCRYGRCIDCLRNCSHSKLKKDLPFSTPWGLLKTVPL
jgi:hypothetical protein